MENQRRLGLHDRVCDFLAPVGGKTVHKEGRLAGARHELVIHLISPKDFEAFFQFVFLTHAGPNVGIDRIGAADIGRIGGPFDFFIRLRRVTLGADGAESQTRDAAYLPQRPRDVVPVADVNQFFAGKRGPRFRQRQQIRKRLAGMLGVAEGIDDRDRGAQRQILEMPVAENARHDGIDP